MIIARVQLVGFKSFATKTTLEFEPGLTAVVGPNGSGKSNVADAVRWVLGEQSKGKLRLEDREEVIFAGTETKSKASFAEVSIVFDNGDGRFPLDLTEVELSRRLYRSGESEYRLAGKLTRLADIQLMLAEAGLSPGGYSVIGQGMVDQLVLSGPAERKLLFDDAAGIRGPELSREAALRKLTATTANLVRLRDIASELEPRLHSLEKVVSSAGQQAEYADAVHKLRRRIVRTRLKAADQATITAREDQQKAQQRISQLETRQQALTQTCQELRQQREKMSQLRQEYDGHLANLQTKRQEASAKAVAHQSSLAEAAGAVEIARGLEVQLGVIVGRQSTVIEHIAELNADLMANSAALDRANRSVEQAGQDVGAAQQSLVALRDEHSDGTRDQYLNHALEILKALANGLSTAKLADDEVKLLVHKAGRLLSHAARRGAGQLVSELQRAQAKLETAMSKRETAVEHHTNVMITRRSLEIDSNHLKQQASQMQADRQEIEAALAQGQESASSWVSLNQLCRGDDRIMAEIDQQIVTLQSEVAGQPEVANGVEAETAAALDLQRCQSELAAAITAAETAAAAIITSSESRQAAIDLASSWGFAEADTKLVEIGNLAELATQLTAAEATAAARTDAQAGQLEEYQAVKARHTEMLAQIEDLELARTDIESVINRLDSIIRHRFKENMVALSGQFSVYFSRLFSGGAADLALEESSDGTYGIQIKVNPAGKRFINLAALSGGERTLTGIALLAAILKVNPSPFIILDEVDAALDEANSGRLANILAELASQSQLIVITHNRQTMQAARELYGVTLTAQHASQVISLQLEEATALAAR